MFKALRRNGSEVLSPEDDSAISNMLFGENADSDDPVACEERWQIHNTHVQLMNHISLKRVLITQTMVMIHVALLGFIATKFTSESVIVIGMMAVLGNLLSLANYKIVSVHIDLSAAAVFVGEKLEADMRIRPIQAVSRTFECVRRRDYFTLRRTEYWTILSFVSLYTAAAAIKIAASSLLN